MTRTISLITATVGAALLFAVPAYGDNWGADRAQPGPTLAQLLQEKNGVVDSSLVGDNSSPIISERTSEMQAPFGGGPVSGSPKLDGVAYFYANERATLADQSVSTGVSRPDSHEILTGVERGYVDAAERTAPRSTSPAVSSDSSSSGRDFGWSQLGIGLGIGIVLALGLYLAMRMTKVRQPAH